MELVGQMYKLSACFDTPNEYKGLPYDYFPEDAVTYGSTICSFGLSYNDHNYGMPTGLTPPAMAPHLMDPVPKPKRTPNNLMLMSVKTESTNDGSFPSQPVIKSALSPASSTTTTNRSSDSTPRKPYADDNEYPVYVEPEIKVVEVPENLCVSASEYSDASSESSDDTRVNPEFLFYLRSLASRHVSIERYLQKAQRHYEQYAASQKSSGSEKREASEFVIDCICEYNYDDRRMVQCEACGIRQHIDCMYTNPRQVANFLKHRCQNCSDIKVDVTRAKAIQTSRKNWHLNSQFSEKWHQRSKIKSEEQKKQREMSKSQDQRNEVVVCESGKSSGNPSNVNRINKRKQDLKAYGAEGDKCEDTIKTGVNPEEDVAVEENNSTKNEDVVVNTPLINECPEDIAHDDPNVFLSDMYSQDLPPSEEVDIKLTGTPMFSSIGEDYTERLALLNRRPQSFKKDYKEATKSLYTDKLLELIKDIQENEEDKKILTNSFEGLDQGPEFLERNPRCRIVLFDGCTIGLEASVRLQSGSIVCALIGRMMLMEEYLVYANPASEHKPFVFLYHNFPSNGIVIDTTVYGNIVRYLRRSCDPNVKLEHTLISGNLYIVVRTTTDICQGVELTIPFDLPFEICQYPVQCACGKVRCPAVKHRRKHHRNRIITSNINCEQVIEEKLRELSQPLCSTPSAYTSALKKPSLLNRYNYQSRSIFDVFSNHNSDIKPSLESLQRFSHIKSRQPLMITEDRIKIEEVEPTEVENEPLETSSKKITSELSGDSILTTKRRPKPILHPDFEMDTSPRITERGKGKSVTPVKPKAEPCSKRTRVCPNESDEESQGNNKESAEFKSIITTRRQKMSKKPKTEPAVSNSTMERRSSRVAK